VDPKTVVLTKKTDAASVTAPKPAVDLKPGTSKYQAKIALGSQQMEMSLATTIKDENGAWTAISTQDSPAGKATYTSTLEKGTLILQKRNMSFGQAASVSLDFARNKAAGSMTMNGQERPIAVDLGGPLFADAAGSEQSIACLPLAEGYSATFRNFDVMKQKVKLMQLKVAGSESVTVPAGTFDAFKVELTSADGGADKSTIWIAKDSRKPVKIAQFIPEMGGATMTAELVP